MNKTHRSLVRKCPAVPIRPHIAFKMSSDGVMKLQRTIGNQAVQRLIQRAPGGKEDKSRPHALATLVLSSKGKLPGDSRIAGHEGKMELLSISLEPLSKQNSQTLDSEEPSVGLTVSRYADNSTQSLMEAYARGEHITSARFEILKFDEDGKVTVGHTFDFSEGLISGVYMGDGGGSDGRPIEVMTIKFPAKPSK